MRDLHQEYGPACCRHGGGAGWGHDFLISILTDEQMMCTTRRPVDIQMAVLHSPGHIPVPMQLYTL